MTQPTDTPPPDVVIADDDPADCDLISDAWIEVRAGIDITCVVNGRDLIDILERRIIDDEPLPAVVLLDLNMPLLDGWAALAEIKEHPTLRSIPIVVFTTSSVPEDAQRAYGMQAAGFITKPVSYRELVDSIAAIDRYWFETVLRPPPTDGPDDEPQEVGVLRK